MSPDVYFAVGGALGAFVRRFSNKDEPTWTRQLATDVVTGAAIMVAINAFGLIPAEWVAAATANPVRAVAVSMIPGIAGIDLLRNLTERYLPVVNKSL